MPHSSPSSISSNRSSTPYYPTPESENSSSSETSTEKSSKSIVPLVDLDEVAAGGAGCIEGGKKLKNGGPKAVYEDFIQKADLFKSDPRAVVVEPMILASAKELAVSAGFATVMGILSGMGLYGGIKGAEDARELDEELNNLKQGLKEKPTFIQSIEQELLKNAKKMNDGNLKISQAMSCAGAAMFSKTVLDVATQAIVLAIGSFAFLAGIAASAPAFILGAAVLSHCLGVLAALCSIYLGVAFYSKSQKWTTLAQENKRDIDALFGRDASLTGKSSKAPPSDSKQTVESPAESSGAENSPAVKKAQDRLVELAKKYENFAVSYQGWNLGFLTNASIYGGCATFQTICITLPALVGITTLAVPSVLCGLFVGSMFGSMFMLVCSQQFVFMLHNQSARDEELRFGMSLPKSKNTNAVDKQQAEKQIESTEAASASDPDQPVLDGDAVSRDFLIASYMRLGAGEGLDFLEAAFKRIDGQAKALRTLFDKAVEDQHYIFTRSQWFLNRNALTILGDFLKTEKGMTAQMECIRDYCEAEKTYLTSQNGIVKKLKLPGVLQKNEVPFFDRKLNKNNQFLNNQFIEKISLNNDKPEGLLVAFENNFDIQKSNLAEYFWESLGDCSKEFGALFMVAAQLQKSKRAPETKDATDSVESLKIASVGPSKVVTHSESAANDASVNLPNKDESTKSQIANMA